MKIPTEPIGSIPRPVELVDAITSQADSEKLDLLYKKAVDETLKAFEKTGSHVITDGEQSKPSFLTYPLDGLSNLSPDDGQGKEWMNAPILSSGNRMASLTL